MLKGSSEMGTECSMSYGAMVQQSATILKNECTVLEDKLLQKREYNSELKKICARQAENTVKQRSELEHYKIITHSEGMQNKSHLSKIHNLRDKLQILDKNFEKLGQTFNPMLGYKNELEDMIKQLKLKQETKEDSCERMKRENKSFMEAATNAFLELRERKEQEKAELCQLKTHLNNQLEQQTQQEKELEKESRELFSACREDQIKIDILEPQRAELKKTFETLKSELAAERGHINATNNRLEITLQEELKRKTQISSELDTIDQNINQTTNELRELEAEIKLLDNKQKQLNLDEEDSLKIREKTQQELQELEKTVEEFTTQRSACMKIESENSMLKEALDDLHGKNNDYKKEVAALSIKEEECGKIIMELKQAIDDLEVGNSKVISQNLIVDDSIKCLQEEQENTEKEHRELSSAIHQMSVELQEENAKLKISCQDLRDQLSKEIENHEAIKKILVGLEGELKEFEAISKACNFKLSNFNEECALINKDLNEKINIFNEDLQRTVEEYEKLLSDCEFNEEVKKEIDKLTEDLQNHEANHSLAIQKLQDSFTKEIENKKKLMDDLRAQCEREYREYEVQKTDAMVELKETKARIIDLQSKKGLVEKEIVQTTDILKKCDNLIQRLMSKFNKVAQVAATSSQSITESASQHLSFATPKPHRKPIKVESPGSESSGKTFDPDDVGLKRRHLQKQPDSQLWAKNDLPSKVPKKNMAPPPPKKKATEDKDDWGFSI